MVALNRARIKTIIFGDFIRTLGITNVAERSQEPGVKNSEVFSSE
jgi:hypothetical protein